MVPALNPEADDLRRPDQGYRLLYVIRFHPRWWSVVAPRLESGERSPDLQCFYVGETSRAVEERFEQHLRGVKTRSRLLAEATKLGTRGPVKLSQPMKRVSNAKHGADLIAGDDIELVPRLYEKRPQVPAEDADVAEGELIDELRSKGHVTWPKGQVEDQGRVFRVITRSVYSPT